MKPYTAQELRDISTSIRTYAEGGIGHKWEHQEHRESLCVEDVSKLLHEANRLDTVADHKLEDPDPPVEVSDREFS